MTGFATSVIACGCEAGIERELPPEETPDGRPGIAVLLFAMGEQGPRQAARGAGRPVRADLRRHRLFLRPRRRRHGTAGQGAALLRRRLPEQQAAGGRRYWRMPVMDGEFLVEETAGGHQRRRRRQFPDPVHDGRRRARPRPRRRSTAMRRLPNVDHAVPRRHRPLGLEGRLALQGADRLDQRCLLPDHPRPDARRRPCRPRSVPCSRSSSTG